MSSLGKDKLSDEQIVGAVQNLGERLRSTDRALTMTDLIGIAEVMTQSMQPILRRIDETLHRELRGILKRIECLRDDISKVHAEDISRNRLPEVGVQLSEVVQATEEATNTIMNCAEHVLSATDKSEDEYKEFVSGQMMEIFEACSFQDLTGQRVNKVVETVEVIEERINHLCDMISGHEGASESVLTEKERAKQEQLLNGPSSNGVNQSEIDAMF